jgi:hypothetical protein
MKKAMVLFAGMIVFFVFPLSCKKNDVNPDEVRLVALESTDSTGTYKTVFDLDDLGRIIKVHESGAPQVAIMNVVYQNNQIIITQPQTNNDAITTIDSVVLIINADNRVQKRIATSFLETKPPLNLPQRTYIYDTTIYEYDGAGLLNKETYRQRDSTWFNPGQVQIFLSIRNGMSTYVNSNGNVMSTNSNLESTSSTYQNGTLYTSKHTIMSNTSFEYAKGYANKTDFRNAAVLDELNLLQIHFNRNYKNLPDKIKRSSEEKDERGTIVSSNATNSDIVVTYNSYGFITSANNGSHRFIYNR